MKGFYLKKEIIGDKYCMITGINVDLSLVYKREYYFLYGPKKFSKI